VGKGAWGTHELVVAHREPALRRSPLLSVRDDLVDHLRGPGALLTAADRGEEHVDATPYEALERPEKVSHLTVPSLGHWTAHLSSFAHCSLTSAAEHLSAHLKSHGHLQREVRLIWTACMLRNLGVASLFKGVDRLTGKQELFPAPPPMANATPKRFKGTIAIVTGA